MQKMERKRPVDKPRFANRSEFGELMAFIDCVFRPGKRGRRIVQRQYPHLYRDEERHMRRHLIVRDGGRIVGQLALHPVQLRLEGVRLKVGGIGTVATDPQRRGEGIMGILLQKAIEVMEARKYDLSILGGDRQRYGWFGWENAGVRTVYSLTPRSLGVLEPEDRTLSLVRNPVLDAPLCRRIGRQGRERAVGAVRPARYIEHIVGRTSRDLWVAESGRRWAYLVLGGSAHQARPYERVDEVGGDPHLVVQALRRIVYRNHLVHLRAMAGPDPYEHSLFSSISSSWSVQSDLMAKVLNPTRLLEQLLPAVADRAKACGVNCAFVFCDTAGNEWQRWRLGRGPEYRLIIGERALVRLLFGHVPLPMSFAHLEGVDMLARLLPLPLYMAPLDHV